MNDTIIQVRSLDQDHRRGAETTSTHITVADRLSVRVGLWLLLRDARRHDRDRAADTFARAAAARQARREHELTVIRAQSSAQRIL